MRLCNIDEAFWKAAFPLWFFRRADSLLAAALYYQDYQSALPYLAPGRATLSRTIPFSALAPFTHQDKSLGAAIAHSEVTARFLLFSLKKNRAVTELAVCLRCVSKKSCVSQTPPVLCYLHSTIPPFSKKKAGQVNLGPLVLVLLMLLCLFRWRLLKHLAQYVYSLLLANELLQPCVADFQMPHPPLYKFMLRRPCV